MSTSELEARFGRAFGEREQRALLRVVRDAYEQSHKEVHRAYERPEARDLRGYICRAKIEQMLRGMPGAFPLMTARASKNAARNCSHTTLRCGKVLLTASRTASRATDGSLSPAAPRGSTFRNEYAAFNQFDLFDRTSALPTEIYAILCHGPDPEDPSKPDFVFIGFPAPDGESFFHLIDLAAKFAAPAEVAGQEPEPGVFEKTSDGEG